MQACLRGIADIIVYNELKNVVTADGNVTLGEPGEVISAKSLDLTGNLSDRTFGEGMGLQDSVADIVSAVTPAP